MSNDVIRVGDRFLVEVEVLSVDKGGNGSFSVSVSGHTLGVPRHFLAHELLAGKRLPRPLKVGDRVRDSMMGSQIATVLAMDGEDAWLKTDCGRFTAPIEDLTPAEESAS